ncbi:hypothetical protein EKO27_g9226 [Xylaria grammica]|uniref:Uncharacterized protein n=1 Tax=Xylaria grammica TaxID=363999 RepID=A0A439CUX4_9PEZI|nr:hypothetical protein EKO27_g9226 [Xylaria grammica]
MTSESSTQPAWRSPPLPYHILKALGLTLLAHIPGVRRRLGMNDERPKQIMRTSVPVAMAHLSIHIPPILASTVIIVVNLKHLYLGRTIPGRILDNDITTAILQIVAKLHELLIVSSISTIIFSAIRVQLLYGDGVPLGLLCSGFYFPQISYFWSDEYWGSLKSPAPRRTLFPFALLLFIAGLIAVTAGPASAVLTVPRQQSWIAGGTSFYLRGLVDDLQPSQVVGLKSTMNELCFNSSAINLSTCPSSGFSSLMAYAMKQQAVKNGDNLHGPAHTSQSIGINGEFGSKNVTIDSATLQIPPSQLAGDTRGLACETSALAPWIPVMMYQEALSNDWIQTIGSITYDITKLSQIGEAEYKYNFGTDFSTRTRIPAVRTACSPAQNVSKDEMTVKFPILPKYSCWNDTASVDLHQLKSTPSSHLRVTWIPLPSTFGATSAGMVFESPWFHDGSSRIIVGCSIDARWADGRVSGPPAQRPRLDVDRRDMSESWGLSHWGIYSIFRPLDDGSWTPITLDESWLAALTPPLTANLTTFEMILQSSALVDDNLTGADNPTTFWNEAVPGASNRTLFLEWMTALLVSDGLSRYGSDWALNSSGAPSEWSLMDYRKLPDFNARFLGGSDTLERPEGLNYTTFKVKVSLEGLSYQAQLITDYLSIAVLLAHIALALGHMVYTLRTQMSSQSWGTITELLILAYNSQSSSTALLNVTAGIRCVKTYRKVAIVRSVNVARSADSESDGDQKQAKLVILADGIKAAPVEDLGRQSRSRVVGVTWPLMSSEVISNIELTKNTRPPSSTALSFTSRNGRSWLEDTSVRRRLLNDPEEQQRIEPDEFYS